LKLTKFKPAKGVKELILIAQEFNLYGLASYKKENLGGTCLSPLGKVEGIEWIRLGTTHFPTGFPMDVLEHPLMKQEPKILGNLPRYSITTYF